MKLIQQPIGTSLCGQCVVAMLANKPLDQVIELMGEGRTYPRDLRRSLKHFDIAVPSRGIPAFTPSAPLGVGAAMIWGKQQHWVAWEDEFWYDPLSPSLLTSLIDYHPQALSLYPITQ